MVDNNNNSFSFYFKKPISIILIGIGLLIILLSTVIYNSEIRSILMTIGVAVFGIGITVPVTMFYQSELNLEAKDILESYKNLGIENIYISRFRDNEKIQQAIDKVIKNTDDIFLLGIAFPSLFDPNGYHTVIVKERLNNPEIKLKIMLLKPDSDAARRRAEIEKISPTIDDIKNALERNIVSCASSRVKKLAKYGNQQINEIFNNYNINDILSEDDVNYLTKNTNLEVRLYNIDPIIYIIGFNDFLFTEQYHFGNPPNKVDEFTCIGKHVPLIQYRKESEAYIYFKHHYDYLWSKSELIYKYNNELFSDVFRILKKYNQTLS